MSKINVDETVENNNQAKKDKIDQVMKHKFFVTQVNYPPQNGFLEYGPVLTTVKNEILNVWRKTLIDEISIEIDTSVMVPYDVLKNSGHIDKFCDVILTDGVTTVRADHFIEENVGEYHQVPANVTEEMLQKVREVKECLFKNDKSICEKLKAINFKGKKFDQFKTEIVKSITDLFECETIHLNNCNKAQIDFIVLTNNLTTKTSEFLPSKDFNLIFKLSDTQYMRPELAQGVFVNFKKAYEFNHGQMPFACYTIGKSYRNEISARGGMFRTKEFYQAEIEYFTPDGSHSDFKLWEKEELLLLPNTLTEPVRMTVKEAFSSKMISCEAICVFLCRAQKFLKEIGIDMSTVRYRQHHCNEMAHYANDCWDVEILTLTGWIECAGIADRSNFDLTVHGKAINPYAKVPIAPVKVKLLEIIKRDVIKDLKSKFAEFEEMVNSIPVAEFENAKTHTVLFEGKSYTLNVIKKSIEHREYIPNVIEPSFGISRIMYALVEQSFTFFEERKVLSLKPKMCFKQVAITALVPTEGANKIIDEIRGQLKESCLRYEINTRNVSIGKKYLSCDEIGIPYFLTVDSETEEKRLITIRERDSTEQVKVKVDEVVKIVNDLIEERIKWSDLKYI